MKISNLIVVLLIIQPIFGQNTFDIKNTNNNFTKKCGDFIELLDKVPNEVHFGIKQDDSENLYFVVTDKIWFDKMFNKKGDGVAVDIVTKDQFTCGKKNDLINSWASQGTLLPPIYLKELKQNMSLTENGVIFIKIGTIPNNLKGKVMEFNLIILQNKNICLYKRFYGIDRYRSKLLDMGLYMDTITYQSQFDTTKKEKLVFHNKRLKFTIPFERNKSEFSDENIQPLYDSLRLTDYNITKIEIRAYSSIEGSTKNNILLQEKRAGNIVIALQSYQAPTIKQTVIASENWVEFFDDLTFSTFSYLTKLSKSEIKKKLKNKELLEKLEIFLKEHRKAILIIDLEKKGKVIVSTPDQILEAFEKSITEKNLIEALEIQKLIFSKIIDSKLPKDFLKSIEIPEKTEYSLLFNNEAVFKYMRDKNDVSSAYLEFKNLQDLFPNDGHIKYNICAFKLMMWVLTKESVNLLELKKEIRNLSNYDISSLLIKRMLINYNIILSEYYMLNGEYKKKDKALRYIYSNYKHLENKDEDLLSIAQYFVSYAKYNWAKNLLIQKVKKIDVNEDLLFYYLNLTIVNPKQIKKTNYRTIMLNAINMNKLRFCKLFSAYGFEGVSFQLLGNDYLKKTYCENCDEIY